MEEEQKETIQAYREAIWNAMLGKLAAKGEKAMDEKEARKLLEQLTDDELADGILFNTPEDVADIVLV
ncbi:hypothetical protein [Prevotella sp. Rep29]|uniref:hypothetical protein n=1 Tax=Prevotella sp. Rep29 TaxID=2691580 RepID=UPI001C6F0FC9|nr:hypothetical protein [Prevotella sp. Rep29]QYR10394.1 hypothetical protein GRF55_04460 [Prevotella sp. Rep29]